MDSSIRPAVPTGGLEGNPLLTVLGRRGRGAVIDALRDRPEATWNVRDLARAADVAPMVASRAVAELAALGVVERFRPGRDMVVRWRSETAASKALAAFDPPDVRQAGVHAFASSYPRRPGRRVVAWTAPSDDPRDPLCPSRVAIIVDAQAEEEVALDDVGQALDATYQGGWPIPDATVFVRADLAAGDPLALAVLAGRSLPD